MNNYAKTAAAACGVVFWAASAASSELGPVTLPLANHVVITAFDLMDQTDVHNELMRTREWTAQWNERQVLAGKGLAQLKGQILAAEVPDKLGYLWLKVSGGSK